MHCILIHAYNKFRCQITNRDNSSIISITLSYNKTRYHINRMFSGITLIPRHSLCFHGIIFTPLRFHPFFVFVFDLCVCVSHLVTVYCFALGLCYRLYWIYDKYIPDTFTTISYNIMAIIVLGRWLTFYLHLR